MAGEQQEGIPQEDFYAINTVWNMRIYDMLTVIARSVNKDEADALIELHSRGKTVGPPPLYIPDQE